MGVGFLHHQVNMPLLTSEVFISARRVCLAWSCSGDLSHQHCCSIGLVTGSSKMETLFLEHLFPSQTPVQSGHLAACLQLTNEPHHSHTLKLAQSFGPNQKLMVSALQ